MFPELFRLPLPFGQGSIPFHTYGLMLAIGFLVGVFLMQRDAKKAGINPDHIANMAFWSLLLGIAGARFAYIVMYRDTFSWSNPLGWFALWEGGLVFQGAILPVIACCFVYIRRHRLDFFGISDAVMPYIPLGHAFGRLGCFAYGCCYACRTSLFWGVRFPAWPAPGPDAAPEGSPAFVDHLSRGWVAMGDAWSLPVHPVQLYGSAGLVALCLVLLWLRKRWNPFPGFLFCMYFQIYGVARFFTEFLRADHNPTHFGGVLTDQQVFALFGFAAMFVLMGYLRRRHAGRSGKPKAA
ncbi:MAG TPA: prolipoprotein diacylglyceryl transferase [Candidatus Hydrogenedentes bacterium]|nr:prolipoprotein diacylglyceryl transferase [Candidatus Hydrogenedentota bacterium]HOS03246.1 prolipoprotein diacylglyceryl transferase [Candidatus Hydrogenedentota bacterium]